MIRWLGTPEELRDIVAELEPYRQAGEAWLQQQPTLAGFCTCCAAMSRFRVSVGATFGDRPNLREGLVCEACQLSNRNRLVHLAVAAEVVGRTNPRLALLEQDSPLAAALARLPLDLTCSEYVDEGCTSGTLHDVDGRLTRHESITDLSFGSSSLDLIVHCDVLEHVPDHRGALRECARVLAPGGAMILSVPFFMHRHEAGVLARRTSDGSIEHLTAAPEYHGDPRRPEGVLTYHHFGWGLLDDLTAEGFCSARIGVLFDLFLGFATNNHPSFEYGLMPPLIIDARVRPGLDASSASP